MGALAEEYEIYGNERERIGLEKGREDVKKEYLDYIVPIILEIHADSGEPLERIVDNDTIIPWYREAVLERARLSLAGRE